MITLNNSDSTSQQSILLKYYTNLRWKIGGGYPTTGDPDFQLKSWLIKGEFTVRLHEYFKLLIVLWDVFNPLPNLPCFITQFPCKFNESVWMDSKRVFHNLFFLHPSFGNFLCYLLKIQCKSCCWRKTIHAWMEIEGLQKKQISRRNTDRIIVQNEWSLFFKGSSTMRHTQK